MSEHEQPKPDDVDLVDRAAAALRDLAVPDGPPDGLLADTLSAIRSADRGPHPRANHSNMRRILTMRFLTKLAVAAVLALVVGSLVWTTGTPWGSQAAFADVLEKVQQAKNVRFKVVSTFTEPGATKPRSAELTMLIAGDRMRSELPGGFVSVTDLKTGQALTLLPQQKRAIVTRMETVPAQLKKQNLLEGFRAMHATAGKPIGHKEIDGRSLDGYAVSENGQHMTIWADPKTRLPVRMETQVNMPMVPVSDVVMKDFEWDVPVDESALSLDVPSGYEVQKASFAAAMPSEAELVESLRILANANGGKFADTFNYAGVVQAFGHAKDKQPDQAQMQVMIKVMRGLSFVQTANGEDFHYAGKGVALGQPRRPIFWYRPAKSDTYHVIDADLTVHTDVKADDLSKVDSQKLAAGTMMETSSSTPAFIQAAEGKGRSPATKGQ